MPYFLIDILVLAAIAVFLFVRLRSVLGEKHGEERRRPDPFSKTPEDEKKKPDIVIPENVKEKTITDMLPEILPELKSPADISKAAEAGITKISIADKDFTPADFLSGAKIAFEMIVEAYAAGKKDVLQPLLGKDLFEAFKQGIEEREKAGHKAVTDILSVKKAEILSASLVRNKAKVTIRFVSDETRYIQDANGNIISGDPGGVHETIDIWTFERDVKSSSPDWLLIETRSEEE